jgi:hypothetical protein
VGIGNDKYWLTCEHHAHHQANHSATTPAMLLELRLETPGCCWEMLGNTHNASIVERYLLLIDLHTISCDVFDAD